MPFLTQLILYFDLGDPQGVLAKEATHGDIDHNHHFCHANN